MKNWAKFFLCGISIVMFFGCAVKRPTPLFEAPDLSMMVKSGKYTQKVDNFLVLLDVSHTMRDNDNGEMKFYWANAAASALNDTISGLKMTGGMRLFGNLKLCSANTSLVCPMQDYSAEQFGQCLDKVEPSFGGTPMYEALVAAAGDIENLQGKTAVIIISDGVHTTKPPTEAVNILKEKYGDKVCISTITIGSSGSLSDLADDSCGAAADFNNVKTAAGMTDFVEKVFLVKKPTMSKPTPPPVVKEEIIILNSIMFDFDSSVIKPEFAVVLEETAKILQQKAGKKVAIEGHTCSMGTSEYNQGLSERRAVAVKNFMITKGVDASRLTSKGAGEQQPIAENTTEEGRKRNRRVEFNVMR
jgi:OOP family OmpA-OmpF porin